MSDNVDYDLYLFFFGCLAKFLKKTVDNNI